MATLQGHSVFVFVFRNGPVKDSYSSSSLLSMSVWLLFSGIYYVTADVIHATTLSYMMSPFLCADCTVSDTVSGVVLVARNHMTSSVYDY